MGTIKNAKCKKDQLKFILLTLRKEPTRLSPEKENPHFTDQKTETDRYHHTMKLLKGMKTTEELRPLSVPLLPPSTQPAPALPQLLEASSSSEP